jgi:hypothetical protein
VTNTTNDVLAAALRYATECAWHVFPALIIGKQKLSYYGEDNPDGSGLKWGMTCDHDKLRYYYGQKPRAGVGIPTGPINDIFVVETDVREAGHRGDGEAALAILVAANGALPDTLMARSPSGSIHRYYRWPRDGGAPIKNSSNSIRLPDGTTALGVDVRGDGGMVVAPPTRRGDGVYVWINWWTPIADAPDWLVAACRAASAGDGGEHVSNAEPEAPIEMVAAAMRVVPNPDDLNWEEWNRRGIAIFNATAGRGFATFDAWSQKWFRYNANDTLEAWRGYLKRPPPKTIGAGTIFHLADEADPDWRDACDEDVVERHYAERDRRADEITREANVNDDYQMAEIAAEFAAEGGSIETAIAEAAAQTSSPETSSTNSTADAEPSPETKPNGGAPPSSAAGTPPPPPPPTPTLRPFVPRPAVDIPPRRWLHAKHYIRNNVVMTVAPGGYGKSSIVIANAIEMALGRGILGPDPTEGAIRVAYWNIEDPAEEVERRIAAFCQQHAIDATALAGRLFVGGRMKAGRRFVKIDRRTGGSAVVNREMFDGLAGYIRNNRIDCVILDPFVAFHGVPENDNGLMEQVVSEFARLAEATGACVELVHHTRKRQGGGNGELTDEDSRGASAVAYATRSIRVINRMTEDEADACAVPREDRSAHIRVDRHKRNMMPAEKATWFRLASVGLANGDEVQAVERWSFSAGDERVDTDLAIWAKEEVGRQAYKTAAQADGWFGHALANRLGVALAEDGVRKRIKITISRLEILGAIAREPRPDGRRVASYFRPGPWVPPTPEEVAARPF